MTYKAAMITFLTLILISGCQTTSPYDPYKIEKSIIAAQVKTIAVMPSSLLIPVENKEEKQQFFNNKLVDILTNQGFSVIPPEEWSRIYEPLKNETGELFDPRTGALQKDKLLKAHNKAREIYFKKFHVDAVLYSGVIRVKANWNANFATWDGVEEASRGKNNWFPSVSSQAYGTIGALSFFVSIKDANKKALYLEFGGIQLFQHIAGSEFIAIPKESVLSDNNLNYNGIRLSICRFLEIWNPPIENETESCR